MRPTRLDLEGFASFRQATHIDFDGADLFVLSGPTGAGKSSIIDAITFALYGTVARYNDRRLVEPVISKGRNEARVALQFRVGATGYTAVRVVRRTKTGASTKEARLEQWRGEDPADARVVAGTADEVSRAVHEVLGLGYEHFTRTVVLPQGAFQQFLHGSQKDRSDLLNELLALGVFDTIASTARTRATALAGEVRQLQAQLDGDLAAVTDETVAAAAGRAQRLATAIEHIDGVRPDLEEILARGRDEAGAQQRLTAQFDAMSRISRPDDVDDLVTRERRARETLAAASEALAAAERERDEADGALDALPSHDAVATQRRRLADLAATTARLGELQEAATAATAAQEVATAALTSTEQRLATAEEGLEHARRGDLVAALTADLHAGDDCPVCARPLESAVEVDASALREAQRDRDAAADAVTAARTQATTAATTAARTQEAVAAATARRTELRDAIEAAPLPDEVAALEDLAGSITRATTRQGRARSAVTTAREARTEAERAVASLQRDVAAAGAALVTARDTVAALDPPAVTTDDLGGSWDRLVGWAREQRRELSARVEAATRAVTTTRARYAEALAGLREQLAGLGIDTPKANQVEELRDAVVTDHARATTEHERLVAAHARRAAVADALAARKRDAAVADSLGRLLDKRNFQRWLTTRAVTRLVVGATRHLEQLTGGAYALALDANDEFAIVDHSNAGELRPARSLSGGETFLASLSLALSLSEHVADLAAGGTARLESLFIDEGFGTLDAATIDVVRTALEELGATGRMVGVVTHVPALAEQLPVQYRVRKESQTSVVERVEV